MWRTTFLQPVPLSISLPSMSHMDDFPLDEEFGFPISPVSSALDALCYPQPQPSISTPSQLDFRWSSGDIPIVLYDDSYAQNRHSNSHTKRGSVITLDMDIDSSLLLKRFSTISGSSSLDGVAPSGIFSMSGSSDTLCSSIFETRRRTLLSGPTSPTVLEFDCQPMSPEPLSFAVDSTEAEPKEYCPRETLSLRNSEVLLTHNSKNLKLADWHFAPSTSRASIATSGGPFESPSLDSSSLLQNHSEVSVQDNLTKKTRTLSWISTRNWDYSQYKEFISREKSSQLSSASDEQNEIVNACPSPSPQKVTERRRFDMGFLSPSTSCVSDSSFPRRSYTQDKDPSRLMASPPQELPPPWLRDTTVQLLIDQEGFRDAEPSFTFSGILRVRPLTDAKSSERLMAQFRPSSRQLFHFHQAPFESPPVLRRITVNNDETSDYVSRQAHLILKSNGVYVVHGHETVSAEHNSGSAKLYWQFEYLVDDRRVEISGSKKNLEDEKTFTPLTFSCSPNLLLPNQAKRINIMQVLKKGVAPKLVAEKFQPPSSGRGPTNGLSSCNGVDDALNAQSLTHSVRNKHDRDGTQSKRVLSIQNHPCHRQDQQDTHHRTCSADNHILRSRVNKIPTIVNESVPSLDSTPGPPSMISCPPPTRHIFPPARLSDLLMFNPPSKENIPLPITDQKRFRASTGNARDSISGELVALSPRPKPLTRKW